MCHFAEWRNAKFYFLSVVMSSVIFLGGIMLSVLIVIVVAPLYFELCKCFHVILMIESNVRIMPLE
jgi:hypothetical protein